MDRTGSVVRNFKFTAASELILALLKFVSRRVFVLLLGKEYLGLNGLFTDILSVLALAELGFGVDHVQSLPSGGPGGGRPDPVIDPSLPSGLLGRRLSDPGTGAVPDPCAAFFCEGDARRNPGYSSDLYPERD